MFQLGESYNITIEDGDETRWSGRVVARDGTLITALTGPAGQATETIINTASPLFVKAELSRK